jgi:hypothetical protein
MTEPPNDNNEMGSLNSFIDKKRTDRFEEEDPGFSGQNCKSAWIELECT